MRLSDGMILEYDWGFVIRQEKDNFVHCSACTWSYLFYLDNTELKNENIMSKIEQGQNQLKLYAQTQLNFKMAEEAADDKAKELKEIINHNPILQ